MKPQADDAALPILSRLREANGAFAAADRAGARTYDAEDRKRAAAVRAYLRARRLREDAFPRDLFADPAWDILLDMFVSEVAGAPVSIKDACVASRVPNSTALRWIGRLEELQLVIRKPDPHDARRFWLSLSRRTYHQIWDWASFALPTG